MDTKIKDIILRNISKSFNGVNIINNLSIEIPAGSKVAVTGKSGAGKSTLVNMLMGFILPDNGKITLMGMDVNEQNINEIRENNLILMFVMFAIFFCFLSVIIKTKKTNHR